MQGVLKFEDTPFECVALLYIVFCYPFYNWITSGSLCWGSFCESPERYLFYFYDGWTEMILKQKDLNTRLRLDSMKYLC
jgi:hypothetical protein